MSHYSHVQTYGQSARIHGNTRFDVMMLECLYMTQQKATITFYGGAGEVTGANFLFDIGDKKILIDCGAVAREHICDDINSTPFAYNPATIDVLIITHAHADHIGRIPKLVHDGFKGTIYSTSATRDLAALMFDDALHVMENDMATNGCTMMYQEHDVVGAMALWQTHEYHKPFHIGTALIEFLDAGHILGSALVKCTRDGRVMLFTGDLGNSPEPLLNDTESAEGANYILMESVYGDRLHEGRDERTNKLRDAIEETRKRQGVLLIPSFSIERTQILLFEIDKMVRSGAIQEIPVYLDAPLGIKVTDVFREHSKMLNPEVQKYFQEGQDPFVFEGLKVIQHTGESEAIHRASNPKVIIAGAGMSNGGRIRAHEMAYLGDSQATVLFVGYQAPGSLGRRIEDGEKDVVIEGERIRVNARIESLTGYSGHKDRDELLAFVETAGQSLQKVFVTMGEPKAEMFLSQRIRDFLNVDAVAPEQNATVTIDW